MSDFAEFIRTLKAKNDIVEVLGSYIKLERRGYNYWACCPFHHEKTPSFSVNAADGYYHCFGCGVSGDVIRFVQEYENIDFMQAVQILAMRAKLDVPSFDDRSAEETAEKKRRRDRLLSLMKDAARFYLNNLWSGRAEEHLAYLNKRGISPSVAKKFGLGASLDFTGLPSYLAAQGYTGEECTESGACGRSEDGRIYDALGGRLIFPIINQLDEVIAFGGRALKPTDRGKYKNTRETPLFNKSKNLYNANLLKREKRAGGISSVIMLEGYFDVVSLYQAGFHNVVASMGTSLTKEQVRLCKRYSDTVLISYDGDAAGQSANLRGLKLLENEGVSIRVVPLPEGLDPDDVVRRRGADAYRECLDAAMPLIDYRLLSAERKYDLSRSEERRQFVKEALSVVREAETATEREELIKRVSQRSGVSYSALVQDLERLPAQASERTEEPQPAKKEPASAEKKAIRFVLAACLFSKPYAAGFDLGDLDLTDPVHAAVAGYITAERARGGVSAGGVFDVVPTDSEELSAILDLDFGENLEGEQAARYFADCAATLGRMALEQRIAEAKEAYARAETREEGRAILARIQEYQAKLKSISIGGKI